ncbi:MAG: competence/damage-inducible protein A [Nitrospinota bacterium]|nr:competence/damage-inducible protein A [Nitrospinota bacterium]
MFHKQRDIRQAAIVVIGNEVTSGLIEETNSRTISIRLQEVGVDVACVIAVGDQTEAIIEALEWALASAEVIVVTGGLGPTHDDITKNVLAGLFQSGFREDEKVLAAIERFFHRRGRPVPDYALEQSSVPEKAEILYNDKGTSPGLLFHKDGKRLYALPGVPLEMEHLLQKFILPQLASIKKTGIIHRLLKTTGITESALWEKIGSIDFLKDQVTVASLPSHLGVNIRLSACGKEKMREKISAAEAFICEKAGNYIYGMDEDTLEGSVGRLLLAGKLTLAVAESCTGGLIGHRITNIAGSADYFLEGFVTYSNAAKQGRIGVKKNLLDGYGAVSRETAAAMAEGVRKVSGADIGLAVTGIAGPEGGSEKKPVGLTFIALDTSTGRTCEQFLFPQDRVRNKERASQAALHLLRLWLLDHLSC